MLIEKTQNIESVHESIFKSDKILFCSDSLCDIIKNSIILIFKDCNSKNTILFNSLDMKSLKTAFYTNLTRVYLCKYYITKLNNNNKITDKYLQLINPKKNLITIKHKQKKTDIKIMMKLLKQVQDPEYIKDIVKLCQIKLIYIINNSPIKYVIKVVLKTNIKDSQKIYSVDVVSICEKYTITKVL